MSLRKLYNNRNVSVDSKVVINGIIDIAARRLLSQSKIQEQLFKTLKVEIFITVSISEYNIEEVSRRVKR